jgi:transposase InsO family protein
MSIGDLVISDIVGPFSPSIHNQINCLIWVEGSSRYSCVMFMRSISSVAVLQKLKEFEAWLERQKGVRLKRVRTDNGSGYIGAAFETYCRESGIIHETTAPVTHEHVGIAERYVRTLEEGMNTLLKAADLSKGFWQEAMNTTNYVRNRTYHSKIEMTPFEAFEARNLLSRILESSGLPVGY